MISTTIRRRAQEIVARYAPSIQIGRFYSRLRNLVQYGDWTFPHAFYIEIGEECNRSCGYCPNAKEHKNGLMSDDIFTTAITRLAELRWAGSVGFHFINEPLLNPKLDEYITRLMSACPESSAIIVTNGDKLTLERADKLFSLGVQFISVSRHAPFSDEWDARIDTVLVRYPGNSNLTQVGKTIAVHTNGQLKHKGLDWQGYCIAPTLACIIRVNGDISMCCCDYEHRAVFGNIKHESIREIWSNSQYRETRSLLRQGIQAHEICVGCSGVI